MAHSSQHPLFNTIRVAVSRYNKRTGQNWQVSAMGQTCKVWAEGDVTPPSDPVAVVPENRPTKFEFIAYLDTIQPGQHFVLPPALEFRFDELAKWVAEHEAQTHKGFAVRYDAFMRELTVERTGM